VRCYTCERRCVIASGDLGFCKTRKNIEGKLWTTTYGDISAISINPIEKKPLYHFYPGSKALTAGSWGCNSTCPWCQNWDITKSFTRQGSKYMSPERFIYQAIASDCQGTSISFNEPTLSLEWSLDVFRLAKEKGLYNTFVTNGYMSSEALQMLIDSGLDAMNIDIKGDAETTLKYCGLQVEKVWRNSEKAKEAGIHLEISTLIIPTVNDDEEQIGKIAERIYRDLGADTPWHCNGYYPAYNFNQPPTSLSSLERAWEIGKEAGLKFVYIGNLPGHKYESTFCPRCGELLIERYRMEVLKIRVGEGKCFRCGEKIPIVI
jgi:pyruvate formate lyase activating enzyme